MMNLFIDSNIWLSLYHFSNDDLEQFGRLREMIKNDINLLIPAQTKNEVTRNRDTKIKDMLSQFEKIDLKFPTFSKSYDEYPQISQQYNDLKRCHSDWLKKINKDIDEHTLPADKAILDFFANTEILECTQQIIRDAEIRYKSGNPPGKDGKLGDAINWECLLHYVNDNEDLFFISADNDYCSVVNNDGFNTFLADEWNCKKNAKVHFYRSLVSFLNDNLKSITLEGEKEVIISALTESTNFKTTHTIIEELCNYSEWTNAQITDLFLAAINNTQVGWIICDDDVWSFYNTLLEHGSGNRELDNKIHMLLEGKEEENMEDD